MIDYSIEEIRTKRKLAYFYCDKCESYLGTTIAANLKTSIKENNL